MSDLASEWYDIWEAVMYSGLATWEDWIDLGRPDPWHKDYDPWRDS